MALFDELKSIGRVLQEAGKIEQYQQILDAQKKLLEMQKRIMDLEEENARLKKYLATEEALTVERNAYWVESGGKRDGPFCTKCKDADGKLIRMRVGRYIIGWALCPSCERVTPDENSS